jgi:hypothetical protein
MAEWCSGAGQESVVVRPRPPASGRVDVAVVVSAAGRTDPFLVVLAASWTGTDGSTRNRLGGGPGLLVLTAWMGSNVWPGPSTRCAKRG